MLSVLDDGPKTRGAERKMYRFLDNTQGDVYRCVLRAIAQEPPQLSFSYSDITKRVSSICVTEDPVGSSIVSTCQQMEKLALEKLPNERVIEWDEQKQVLDVPDPYLIFYLRWSDHLGDLKG